MKGIMKASATSTENPNKWLDEEFQLWFLDNDAIKETRILSKCVKFVQPLTYIVSSADFRVAQ